jgi:hypothetical protein
MKIKYSTTQNLILIMLLGFLVSCQRISPSINKTTEPIPIPEEGVKLMSDKQLADVVSVDVSGEPGDYTFSIEISSPDTGCEQYADWWEVINSEGELVYRRILLHSHVAEQPFVRSGGPVEIEPETEIILRAHMNPGGYGGKAFKGSVGSGFEEVDLAEDFGADLENHAPLPSGCDF